MERKTLLSKIKEDLKNLFKFEVKADATLEDGTLLSTNGATLGMGVEVNKIDAEGNLTPLEDGDYVLADGTKFSIANGAITAFGDTTSTDTTAADTTAPATEPDSEAPGEVDTPEETGTDIADLTDRVTALEDQVGQLMEVIQKLMDNSNSMMKRVEKHLKEPGAEAATFSKNVKKNEKNDKIDPSEALDNLRKINSKKDWTAISTNF